MESRHKLRLGPYTLPLSAGEVRSFRQGKAFWQILSEHGIPTTILRMPVNFPPVRCHCQELSGMGTPDLQGTFGTFTFFTDDPGTRSEQVAGRPDRACGSQGQRCHPAPGRPRQLAAQRPLPHAVEIVAHVDPAARAARFDLPGDRIILKQGEWSDWLRVSFPLIPAISATGIIRIYAKQLQPRLQIYVSPVNIDPGTARTSDLHPRKL